MDFYQPNRLRLYLHCLFPQSHDWKHGGQHGGQHELQGLYGMITL